MILHIHHSAANLYFHKLYFQDKYIHINNPIETYSYVKIVSDILHLLRHYFGTFHSFNTQFYSACHTQRMTCKHAKHRLIDHCHIHIMLFFTLMLGICPKGITKCL
jgi:hypothetical protein